MTIGNFEWQTTTIVRSMIEVNLIGAMNVTSSFLPELRKTAENVSRYSIGPDSVATILLYKY